MDACRATYSFNDNALLKFEEILKDAVDPNGILSAGRYGIWPKHLRNKKMPDAKPDLILRRTDA